MGVEISSPPITERANEACISLPIAIGISPIIAVNDVINTGLNLLVLPVITEDRYDLSFQLLFYNGIYQIVLIALLTTIPPSINIPIIELRLMLLLNETRKVKNQRKLKVL